MKVFLVVLLTLLFVFCSGLRRGTKKIKDGGEIKDLKIEEKETVEIVEIKDAMEFEDLKIEEKEIVEISDKIYLEEGEDLKIWEDVEIEEIELKDIKEIEVIEEGFKLNAGILFVFPSHKGVSAWVSLYRHLNYKNLHPVRKEARPRR